MTLQIQRRPLIANCHAGHVPHDDTPVTRISRRYVSFSPPLKLTVEHICDGFQKTQDLYEKRIP